MADIAFRFGKVKFVDTGTALSIYYNNVLVGSIDSSGNIELPVADSTGSFKKLAVNASIGVTEEAYIEGDLNITGIIGKIKLINGGDSDRAGIATLGLSGSVTINTDVIGTKVLPIPAWRETGGGFLSIDNIVNGTSFDIISSGGAGDSGKEVSWFLVEHS